MLEANDVHTQYMRVWAKMRTNTKCYCMSQMTYITNYDSLSQMTYINKMLRLWPNDVIRVHKTCTIIRRIVTFFPDMQCLFILCSCNCNCLFLYVLQRFSYLLDVRGSLHHNINLIKRSNEMQQCSRIYYSNVSWLLNMFRSTPLIIRSSKP
jgi:hypothetical protein